jgi:ATP-grasp domain, R2K clade family 3
MVSFLFPSEPFSPRRVDSSFAREAAAVENLGCDIYLVDLESLVDLDDGMRATRLVPPNAGLTIYRGWMLTPSQYADLFAALSRVGTVLINNPDQYRRTHYLPESYSVIADITPRTVWISTSDVPDIDQIAELLAPFGDSPVIVMDYVKSRKHEWDEACFIPSASDRAAVERIVGRFCELQGSDLHEGLVFREYVPLRGVGSHPKSGMPLSEEYRTFVLDGKPVLTTTYWEDGTYSGDAPPLEQFTPVLQAVQSRFFTVDLARTVAGGWIIVELGDGQVAGLPEDLDPELFYRALFAELDL